jgi:hypothetical protein
MREDPLDARDVLRHLEAPRQHEEETGQLAFLDEPLAGTQVDVGGARRDRFALGLRDRLEQGNGAEQLGGDHRTMIRQPRERQRLAEQALQRADVRRLDEVVIEARGAARACGPPAGRTP